MTFNLKQFEPQVAYMSMGAYLESYLPTYSGGLEILAGDILRSCADLRVPVVGVIQASNSGYFKQRIDESGWQQEEPVHWTPKKSLPRLKTTVTILNEGRPLEVGAEVFEITGITGYTVPVLMLDTDFESNDPSDIQITSTLYGNEQRISQENVLGQAGVKLLKALGYDSITTFHMNEGHAAFGVLELMAELGNDAEAVKKLCAFTTHTPVPAGHDKWMYDDAKRVAGDLIPPNIIELAGDNQLNMTQLAISLSRYVNAVSRKHSEVCKEMDLFQGTPVDYITNGIHLGTWVSESMAKLLDSHLKYWRIDPRVLDDVVEHIPNKKISAAKSEAKRRMIGEINAHHPVDFDQDSLTVVWARRFTPYKRADLMFRDIDRLYQLAEKYGKIQLVFAGKAHPADEEGKKILQNVINNINGLDGNLTGIFIEGYDTKIAKRLLGGADVWLNTPRRPQEASGTSGMKAAVNGAINLSSYDGWIIEGKEISPGGIIIAGSRDTKLIVSPEEQFSAEDDADAAGIYDGLEQIMRVFYSSNKDQLASMMLNALRLGSHFNTNRVVKEYSHRAWDIK